MIPGELMLSAQAVRRRLAALRGTKLMDHNTLLRAIRKHGLPAHPNPFGTRGYVFYWSEVEAWLANPVSPGGDQPRRGPGRPRKHW